MDDYFRDTRSYIIFYIHIWIKHVFASFTVCGCAGVSVCVCVWCVVVLSLVSFINREQHECECECECVSSNICFYTLCLQIPSPPHRKQIRHKHKLALYIWNNTQKIEFVVICLFVFGWASLLLHFFFEICSKYNWIHTTANAFFAYGRKRVRFDCFCDQFFFVGTLLLSFLFHLSIQTRLFLTVIFKWCDFYPL